VKELIDRIMAEAEEIIRGRFARLMATGHRGPRQGSIVSPQLWA
jgi:hypothetical protein